MSSSNLYLNGKYLAINPNWHSADSPWKASKALHLLKSNLPFPPKSVLEVGCGSGVFLDALAADEFFSDSSLFGYDISPDPIRLSSKLRTNPSPRVSLAVGDPLFTDSKLHVSDLLVAIDVIEHVPDYIGFLTQASLLATYSLFHIPLDLHVSSILRNEFVKHRDTLGHIHYFTLESALSTLDYCGFKVLDFSLTNAARELPSPHPFRRGIANLFRASFDIFSPRLTSRLLGGYSLMVLCRSLSSKDNKVPPLAS